MPRRRRRRADITDDELDRLEVAGSDVEWWAATGTCGGCASARCHPRKACVGAQCQLCPSRDTDPYQEAPCHE